jgi:hypothetical protein
MTDVPRNYTRWTGGVREGDPLVADMLGVEQTVVANPATGKVELAGASLSPDLARMIGVRLIEAAALADGDRAIRRGAR